MKNVIYPLLLCTGFLLVQCTPFQYTPNSNATPVFNAKGEKQINANLTLQTAFESGEAQFAWAPVKNVGLVGNTLFLRNSIFSGNNTTRLFFGELGTGVQHIFKFGSDYEHTGIFFALYAGAGLGNTFNDLKEQASGVFGTPISVNGTTNLKYSRLYSQGYFGFTNRNIEFGLSLRRSNIKFSSGTFTGGADFVITSYEQLNAKAKYRAWEPAAFVRTGSNNFKYFVQIGGSTFDGNLSYPQCISTGFSYRFGGSKPVPDIKEMQK